LAAKLLGWQDARPEGHPDGLSDVVYAALRDKIFLLPKVERDHAGRSIHADSSTHAICTCPENTALWQDPTLQPGGLVRARWLEFLHHKGLIDKENAIIWAANPASHLSSWGYQHMLVVSGTSTSAAASATAATARALCPLGSTSTSLEVRTSGDVQFPRAAGGDAVGGRRVATDQATLGVRSQRLLPPIAESASWKAIRPWGGARSNVLDNGGCTSSTPDTSDASATVADMRNKSEIGVSRTAASGGASGSGSRTDGSDRTPA
jgi:hypothetical protein